MNEDAARTFTRAQKLDLLAAYGDAQNNAPATLEVFLDVEGVTRTRLELWQSQRERDALIGDEEEHSPLLASDGSILLLGRMLRAVLTQGKRRDAIPLNSAVGRVIYDDEGKWRVDYFARARSALTAVFDALAIDPASVVTTRSRTTPAQAVAAVRASWGIDHLPRITWDEGINKESEDRAVDRWAEAMCETDIASGALRDWYVLGPRLNEADSQKDLPFRRSGWLAQRSGHPPRHAIDRIHALQQPGSLDRPESTHRARAVASRQAQARFPKLQEIPRKDHPEYITQAHSLIRDLFYAAERLQLAPGATYAKMYIESRRIVEGEMDRNAEMMRDERNRMVSILADLAANLTIAPRKVRASLRPGQADTIRRALHRNSQSRPFLALMDRNSALALQNTDYSGAITRGVRGVEALRRQHREGRARSGHAHRGGAIGDESRRVRNSVGGAAARGRGILAARGGAQGTVGAVQQLRRSPRDQRGRNHRAAAGQWRPRWQALQRRIPGGRELRLQGTRCSLPLHWRRRRRRIDIPIRRAGASRNAHRRFGAGTPRGDDDRSPHRAL